MTQADEAGVTAIVLSAREDNPAGRLYERHGFVETHPLIEAPDWPDREAAAPDVLDRLVDAAQRDGAIGEEVTARNIAFATIRFCRPLAIGLDREAETVLAHRQLVGDLDVGEEESSLSQSLTMGSRCSSRTLRLRGCSAAG